MLTLGLFYAFLYEASGILRTGDLDALDIGKPELTSRSLLELNVFVPLKHQIVRRYTGVSLVNLVGLALGEVSNGV